MRLKARLNFWIKISKNLINKDVWIIDGIEISTGQPLKIIFAGRIQNKFHIINLGFRSDYKETYLGNKKCWELYFLISKNRSGCSMAIIEGIWLDRYLYNAAKSFFVPLWLEGIVDLPLDRTSSSVKEDVRKIRKTKLEYFVTEDLEKIHVFFHKWYLPMIRAQHKERAFEYTYDIIERKVKEGCCQLLISTKEGVPVAGVMIQTGGEIPKLWINGISDIKFQKEGALTSTYYFAADYLEKIGYINLSLANTRSFLTDGLLQYKKKWHPRVSSSDTRGYIIKFLKASLAIKGFFMNNPFTYIENGNLYGCLFVADRESLSSEVIENFKKSFLLKGFSSLNVFSFEINSKGNCRNNGIDFILIRKIS